MFCLFSVSRWGSNKWAVQRAEMLCPACRGQWGQEVTLRMRDADWAWRGAGREAAGGRGLGAHPAGDPTAGVRGPLHCRLGECNESYRDWEGNNNLYFSCHS